MTRPRAGGSVEATPTARPRPARRPRLPFSSAGGWRARLAVALERLALGIGATLARERDRGAGFLWLTIGFAAGILGYFSLPAEPWLSALAALSGGLWFAAWRLRGRGVGAALLALAAVAALGAATAKIGADWAVAPRLDRERSVSVAGWVEQIEGSGRGRTRLVLAVATMAARGLQPEFIPRRITVTVSSRATELHVGDGVSMTARLTPPHGPVIPGGYDFARRAYFDGRGASGYALGRVALVELGPPPAMIRLAGRVADLRHAMATRIRASLPGVAGEIAAALIVGEQRGISDQANDWLRAAGLYHIISISGLHMSLVAGGAIAILRFGLALVPAISLRYPVKKWAAGFALVAATVYLWLSGAAVATERSYVMIAVALMAMLLDRPALTLRTVAVSAIALLALDPSALLEPSFQMSYLAVIGLITAYAIVRARAASRPKPPKHKSLILAMARAGGKTVAGLALSSVVAGIATGPIIADSFYRAAPYSLLANMIVLPVIGIVVMPAAVAACLAMPFGLEAWPLWAMAQGIEFMLAVARFCAGLPGGEGLIGRIHPAAAPLSIAGLLWLALWRSRWRYAGLAPLAAAFVVAPLADRPDLIVADPGQDLRLMPTVALRGDDGRLHILTGRDGRFAAATWLAADADARSARDATLAAGWTCDRLGCVFARAQPQGPPLMVAVVTDAAGFDDDCRLAAIVISSLPAPPDCADKAAVFDLAARVQTGAAELRFSAPADPAIAALRPEQKPQINISVTASRPPNPRPWTAIRADLSPTPRRPSRANTEVAPQRSGPAGKAKPNAALKPSRPAQQPSTPAQPLKQPETSLPAHGLPTQQPQTPAQTGQVPDTERFVPGSPAQALPGPAASSAVVPPAAHTMPVNSDPSSAAPAAAPSTAADPDTLDPPEPTSGSLVPRQTSPLDPTETPDTPE